MDFISEDKQNCEFSEHEVNSFNIVCRNLLIFTLIKKVINLHLKTRLQIQSINCQVSLKPLQVQLEPDTG